MNASASAPRSRLAEPVDAFMQQLNESLTTIETLARSVVTDSRAAEILDLTLRRLTAQFLQLPIDFGVDVRDELREYIETQISAIRALRYNRAQHGTDNAQRFAETTKLNKASDAAFDQLLALVREKTRKIAPYTEVIDGSHVMLDLASRQREVEFDDKGVPRGDYRSSVQAADYDAVFDIAASEFLSIATDVRPLDIPIPDATAPFGQTVLVFDIKKNGKTTLPDYVRNQRMRRRIHLDRDEPFRPPFVLAAGRATTSPTDVPLTLSMAKAEVATIMAVLDRARRSQPKQTVQTSAKGDALVAVPSEDLASALGVIKSVGDAWVGGRTFTESLYRLVHFLFIQQNDVVQHELKNLRARVELQLERMYQTERQSTGDRAAFVIFVTKDAIAQMALRSTSTQLLADPIVRAYNERLNIYLDLEEKGDFERIVKLHIDFLQQTQARITDELSQVDLTVERKLGMLRDRLAAEKIVADKKRLEDRRQRADQSTANQELIAQNASLRNSIVINETTGAIEQVLNVPVGPVPSQVDLVSVDDDGELPPLIDYAGDEEPRRLSEPAPVFDEPATFEYAHVDDIELWRKGFDRINPVYVIGLADSTLLTVAEKIKLIGQFYVYAESVGTRFNGGMVLDNDGETITVPFLTHVEDAYDDLFGSDRSRTERADYVSPRILLARLQSMQLKKADGSFYNDVFAGDQLNILPNETDNPIEYRAVLKYLAAFSAKAKELNLVNAYRLGPVLTKLFLIDDAKFQLRFGDIDADEATQAQVEAMLHEQHATLFELASGLHTTIATPVEAAMSDLKSGFYSAGVGSASSIVIEQEVDGSMIDPALKGRFNVAFYKAPDNPERQREIDDMLARFSDPYKVFYNVQDVPIGSELEATTSPLITQTRRNVPWQTMSRMEMIDLTERSTIVVTRIDEKLAQAGGAAAVAAAAAAGGPLVQELLRMRAADISSMQAPTPPFVPNFADMPNPASVNLREADQQYSDVIQEYMTTEKLPDAFNVREASERAAAAAAAAEKLRQSQQSYYTQFMRFIGTSRYSDPENDYQQLYGDEFLDRTSNVLSMALMALKAVTKLLYVISGVVSVWGGSTILLSRLSASMTSASNYVASRFATLNASAIARYAATFLNLNGVTNSAVWQALATVINAVGTTVFGSHYDELVLAGLLMLEKAVRALGDNLFSVLGTIINTVFHAVKWLFGAVASIVSLFAISVQSARGVMYFVSRAHYYVDTMTLLLSAVALPMIGWSGLHYFSGELTHQMISGVVQLNVFKAMRSGIESVLSAGPLSGDTNKKLTHVIYAAGVTSSVLAPWLTGTSYPIYGFFAPLLSGGLLVPVTSQDVFASALGGAAVSTSVRYLAAVAGRSLGTALNDFLVQKNTDGDLPLEGLFRGVARLTRAGIYRLFASGRNPKDLPREARQRNRLQFSPELVQTTNERRVQGVMLTPSVEDDVNLQTTTGVPLTDLLQRELRQAQVPSASRSARADRPVVRDNYADDRSDSSESAPAQSPIQYAPATPPRPVAPLPSLPSTNVVAKSLLSAVIGTSPARSFATTITDLILAVYDVDELTGTLQRNAQRTEKANRTGAGVTLAQFATNAKNYITENPQAKRIKSEIRKRAGLERMNKAVFSATIRTFFEDGYMSPETFVPIVVRNTNMQSSSTSPTIFQTVVNSLINRA